MGADVCQWLRFGLDPFVSIENLQQAQAPVGLAVPPADAFEPATDLTEDEPNDLPF